MDPVSVVSVLFASASLLKVLGAGVTSLSLFVRQSESVDETVHSLLQELSTFMQTVQTIETALSSPIIQNSTVAHEDYRDLWISLDGTIKECYATGKTLERSIDSVQVRRKGFWGRSVRQFKLNINNDDIVRLRDQIHAHVSTLSMALDTINLIATIIGPNQIIKTLGDKIDDLKLTMVSTLTEHHDIRSRAMSDADTIAASPEDSIAASLSEPLFLNTASRNEALREASKNGDLKPITSLLEQGVNVNQRDASGATALHYATSCGQDEAVQLLLRSANVNAANKEGLTPLHLACRRGYHQIVSILLTSENINVDLQNNVGETALHHAAYLGFHRCIAALSKANPLLLNKHGEMPLHLASSLGHMECVKLLLENPKSEPNGKNAWQETGLHLAAAHGRLSTVEVLMKYCYGDSKDGEGKTPLHLAVMKRREDVVKLLLNCANPNSPNAFGQTPRDIAAFGGSSSMMALFEPSPQGFVDNKVSVPTVEVLDVTGEVK